MDSDTHPSIITQVTPDGERAKLVAELQNQAAADVSIPDVQFNENSAAETVFSPTPKIVENSTLNDASRSGGTGDSQAAGSDSKQSQSSGKLKSLFCCFKLCKRSGKQRGAHRYMAPSAAAKQGATVGIPQTEGPHPNSNGAQPSAATGNEPSGDAARPRSSAASANGSAATGTQPVAAPHVVPPVGPFLLPPLRPDEPSRRCVVVDLDETLVHSSFKPVDNPDLTVDVEIDGQVHQVYVLKRPFVDEFLTRLGQLFECVLFTASLSKYADPVTNWLDPGEQKVFSARLFRDACVPHKGNYVKDLSRLGRPLDGVVIVDNSPVSYFFHPQNAVPVKTWFDDASDHELLELIPLFEQLATCPDIYSVIAQYQAERQAQQARELALLRSLSMPMAYATNAPQSPAAALVTAQPQPHPQALIAAQLPAYQYSYQYQYQQPTAGDQSPSPPLPDYASLQPAASPPPQPAPQDPPAVPAEQSSPGNAEQSQEAAVALHGAPVIVSVPNASDSPAGSGSRRQSASGAPSNSTCSTGRSTPVTGLEAPTANTTGHESATENDEDRSLFSPLPIPPLFVTPPTPRPGEAGGASQSASQSHSHSPTGSSAEAAQASSDSDAETAPALQRRNSAGSRRSGSQDSQKQHTWRPASTQPLDGSHGASNNNGKPQVVVHAASDDGALL